MAVVAAVVDREASVAGLVQGEVVGEGAPVGDGEGDGDVGVVGVMGVVIIVAVVGRVAPAVVGIGSAVG